jgi:predicted DNA binding CopG/RHH family protein
MKNEYDFSALEQVENPYTNRVKKQITIRIDAATIDYFKEQASAIGIPYQNLINLYLVNCAEKEKKLEISWE